jgi:hypothetical protein
MWLVWCAFPLLSAAVGTIFRTRPISRDFFYLGFVYAFIYLGYAANGPSDPNGAGHMHLVIIPMFLFLLTAVAAALAGLRVLVSGKRRTDASAGVSETSPDTLSAPSEHELRADEKHGLTGKEQAALCILALLSILVTWRSTQIAYAAADFSQAIAPKPPYRDVLQGTLVGWSVWPLFSLLIGAGLARRRVSVSVYYLNFVYFAICGLIYLCQGRWTIIMLLALPPFIVVVNLMSMAIDYLVWRRKAGQQLQTAPKPHHTLNPEP